MRRDVIASGQGLLSSEKLLRTRRETCSNGFVSHSQEFVEQKGDHAVAKQGSWQRALLWKDHGGPENTEPTKSLPPW